MAEISDTSHAVLDVASRHEKAAKIIAVVSQFTDLSQAAVLDIGTGAGVIASDIAAKAKTVTSVDMTDERKTTDGYEFVQVNSETLPFKDASFDVVIYNHVVEHVPHQQQHLAEIARVTRPGGIMYLATPNKFGPMDPHYKLPLVSWLPRSLAGQYVRLVRRKQWDIYPVSPWDLRRLTAGSFAGHNVTAEIIKYPARYNMPAGRALKLLGRMPLGLLKLLQPFVPTQIHIFTRLAQ